MWTTLWETTNRYFLSFISQSEIDLTLTVRSVPNHMLWEGQQKVCTLDINSNLKLPRENSIFKSKDFLK
jgi:hypothetical protein